MKALIQKSFVVAVYTAALLCAVVGATAARAGVSISMGYPLAATPCDTLSVTTTVVNTGATLSQLQIDELLPGGNVSYQYVTNSMQVIVQGGVTITNESLVLTNIGGTNLLFNLSNLQSTNGPTNLVLSQVFPGAAPDQAWFQIYNPTVNPISTAGWSVRDARPGVTNTLPTYTIPAGGFLVVAANTNIFMAAYPSYTGGLVPLTNNFAGNGLAQYADGLFLMNASGVTVDDVSWGFDTSAFNPAVAYPTTTASLARNPANVDTGTAADWVQETTPTPGSVTVQNGLAAGSTINIIYQLTAKCGGVGGYFNTTATYEQPSGGATQTNNFVDFIAFENPVLLVSKTPQIQEATLGGLVTWQLQVINSGFGTARNTVLYDSIGSGLTFVGFSIPPTTASPLTTNAVYWDLSAIPALAGLTNGETPVSITVTARVNSCALDLNNRGDASFGCSTTDLCQDTRLDASGAEAAIEYLYDRPYLTFTVTPTNTLAIPYCGGTNITISVTNNNYFDGASAYGVSISPNLVPGYTLTPVSGTLVTNASGGIILSEFLPQGGSTNVVLHLEPGGVCPLNTNVVAQLLVPGYTDGCGITYAAPIIPVLTYLSGLSAAALVEDFSPSAVMAGTTTNITVLADLVYTNMGAGLIPQTLVQKYPTNSGWGTPTSITGGGVLNTSAHTITWTTNVSGSGQVLLSFQIQVTKPTTCMTNIDSFTLTPAAYADCHGCTQYVDTNSLIAFYPNYGCGTGGCDINASISTPAQLVETCQSQPFTVVISNLTGTFPSHWTNVALTATLSAPFASTNSVAVKANGVNVTSDVTVSQAGGTLVVHLDGLNNVPAYANVTSVTNLQVSWDAEVSQAGPVTQYVQFNLCSEFLLESQWSVGTSLMHVTLNPPFLGFECGLLTIPIGVQQLASPYSLLGTNYGIFPDYNVDVVLNLDPTNDPEALGIGEASPYLSFVTNSTVLTGIITNAAGNQLILTNVPVVTNNLVIWHLGNLGVFTNGNITCQFQMRCGGAPIQQIQALLRYNNRCNEGTTPQALDDSTPIQLVSDQTSSLSESVSPALVSMITTNFNFQAQFFNAGASPAHNFFIEVQVPTNIVLTAANVPWNYVYALNPGTNAYHWSFTNNAAPLQGLVDSLGDGSFNDLAYEGQFDLSVTGAVISCVNETIETIAGSGCLGSICQEVGPLPVTLQPFTGTAVAMLVFPTALPVCTTNSLYYDVRNASLSSIYQVTPSFFLPSGLIYISGTATATNKQTGQSISIPDPSGAGTTADPYTWSPSQVSYLQELVSANDVIIGFKVKVDCDSTVSGEGGASATYLDTCHGLNQTPTELSAGILGLPNLSLTKAFYDLNNNPKTESMPGETNVFRLTIAPTATSAATVQGLQLSDYFPTNSFNFIGASIKPDSTAGGVLTWSNSTLMAAIPNQNGGPYYITSAPISLVITTYTLASCSSPSINSALLSYGCADSLCQSATATATVVMTSDLETSSPSESMQLSSCGGTYTTTIANNGAAASGIILTNYAPAGFLIAGATVTGALYSPTGQEATITLVGSGATLGKSAILNLSNTNLTNVRGTTNYTGGAAGTIYLGPGQSFTVTYSLIPSGATLDCTVNTYPPAPVPVTITNSITFDNVCGSPATTVATFTALPSQPKPEVTLTPASMIVTNGQVQNFIVTLENAGTYGNASDLEARVLFQSGWTNLVILGVTNNTAGGATNTGSFPITTQTNAQNGVLANLNQVILEPLETVVIGIQATAIADGGSLGVQAELVGGCGTPSPAACSTFSPTNPLAMTMPPSPGIPQLTNDTIYGFYQQDANGVGFNLTKTVRYLTETAAQAGTNRIARVGEPLIYEITAQYFDTPFTNIIVNDSLPPNLVYGTPIDVGSTINVTNWTYNPATGNFTLPTPVTNNATFVIDFPVTVTNGLLNQAGVSFTNVAESTFNTVVTNVPPPASTVVSVVEPTLSVTNLVSLSNGSFSSSVGNVQASNTLYYEIVITNLPGTNAYNLWLSNSLPAGFTAPTIVSVASTGSVLTNGVPAGTTLAGSLLNFTNGSLNLGTNVVEVDTNSSITIVFSVQPGYTVEPNESIPDQTTIQWTSMPGSVPQERTGVGLIPPAGTNDSLPVTSTNILNNYADTSAAAVTTIKNILFSKVLVGTSQTALGNGNTNATVGELVGYSLSLTVPQGVTTNATITDNLPVGLAFVGVTNVSWSAGVSNSLPITVATNPANTTIVGSGHNLTFSLGNVTNLNNNNVAAGLTISFQAVVLDVLTNQASTNWVNPAKFTSGSVTTNVVSAGIQLVEPTLQISETVSTNVNSGFALSVSNIQAGNTIYYQLLITNSAGLLGTTAYDLWLSNSLPAGLVNPTVVSVANVGVGNVYSNGVAVTGSLSPTLFGFNGTLLTAGASELDLDTNGAILVEISAQIPYSVNPLSALPDETTIEWSSLPGVQTNLSAYNPSGNARTGVSTPQPAAGVNNSANNTILDNYAAASAVSVSTVAPPYFSKVLVSTSSTAPGNGATNATIGELVTYTLNLTVPQGVTTNATITDNLPVGLAFVNVTNVSWSPNVSNSLPITVATNPANTTITGAGHNLTFSLGNVTNLNSSYATNGLSITFQTVVLDVLTNQASTNWVNPATFTSGSYSTNVASAGIQVVEPTLQISELVSTNVNSGFALSVSNIQAGNTIYYQLLITNSAGLLGTTAYDLWLSNSLPAGLVNPTVVSVTNAGVGNVYSNGVAVTGSLSPSLFNFNGTLLTTGGSELDLNTNGAIIVVVSAQVAYSVNPLSALPDETTIEWSSLPGVQTNLSAYNPAGNSRTGVTTPQPAAGVNNSSNNALLDNYAAASAVSVSTVAPPYFSKVLVSTSSTAPGNGATNATIGELVTYTLNLTVPQGVTTNATITDTLPVGLAFVNVTNVSWSPNVSNSLPITVATNPANTTITGTGHNLTFNLGNVTNLNSSYATNGLAITFQAVVLDVLTNQASTNWVNPATFTSGSYSTNVASAGIQLVEPTLQISELVSTNVNTGFALSVSNIQAGNTIYYQMLITNSAGLLGTTAYDLWLSNSLPAGLVNPTVVSVANVGVGNVYSNGVAVTGTLSPSLFTFNGTLLTAGNSELDLDTNGAIIVEVAAQVAYTVNPLTALPDETTIEWSSLPGVQTNLSAYNPAGNSRTGVTTPQPAAGVNNSSNNALLDNYAAASGVLVSTVAPPYFSKVLVGTSNTAPGNGSTNATIGELVTYTLNLTVPQGVTTNATIVDTLPVGLAFVGVTNVSWSPNVSNSLPITVATNPANTTITGTGHSVTFSLGNVTNLNSSYATNGVAITFQAVVLDVLTNQAGTNWVNPATFTSGSYSTNVVSAGIQVVEPTLQITESISADSINYGSSIGGVVAGNTVYYQLVITNSAGLLGTTAYDLWLSNSLPVGLINPTVYSITNSGPGDVYTNGLTATNGLSTSLFAFSGNELTVAPGAEIDLDTNGSIVLVVAAQLAGTVQPGQSLADNTTIEWASLPGTQTNLSAYNPSGNSRTGVSTPLPAPGVNNSTNNTLLDNYAAASGVTLASVPAPVLSKGIVAADEPGVTGNSGVNGTNATIGELVTYRITVGLPQGTTPNLVVTDQLPAGLAFVTNSVVLGLSRPADANPNIPGTGSEAFGGTVSPPTVSPATPTNGAIAFSFGPITVNADSDTNNNVFSFTYQAVVLNIPTNSGLSNIQTTWTNTFTWVAGLTSSNGLTDASGNVVAVVEPNLTFQQSVLVNNELGNSCGYLGSPVVYTLTIGSATNSLSTAYNVGLVDQLPLPVGATISTPLTMANVVITNDEGVNLAPYFTLVGGLLETTNGSTLSLATNDSITIVVSGVVNGSASPIGVYTNLASLSYSTRNGDYTTNSGFNPNPYLTTDQERLYAATNSTAFTLNIDSIAGYVYGDTNNNGIFDAGETGLAGVTVTLIGTNINGQVISVSTNTAANGSYLFGSLLPGDYIVDRTSTPAGYLAGKQTAGTPFGGVVNNTNGSPTISAVNIPTCASDNGANYNFGLIQPNSLSGMVFADLNRDGLYDNTDYPITNVTVTLTGTNYLGQNITNVMQTLTNGAYDFTGLLPGTYTILETQPAGYGQGTNALGSVGGTNSAQDVFSGITLNQNQNGTNYNFGEVIADSISGYVYADANNDGIFQNTETPLGGVTVTLTGTNIDGQVITLSTNTAPNGYYYFGGLLPGNYVVDRTTTPAGYIDGKETAGTPFGGVVDNTTTNSTDITGISIPSGGVYNGVNYNLGLIQPDSVSGLVFADLNRNGIYDGSDYPITNVTITLTGTNFFGQLVTNVLQTLSNGTYDFTGLLPGTYSITETQPAGYGQGTNALGTTGGTNPVQDTFASIVLGQNQNGTGYNFGEVLSDSISGYVYADANNDGTYEPGETPLGGVTVTLTGTNLAGQVITLSTNTAPDGSYDFGNLLPGNYVLDRASTPAGYIDGQQTPGTPFGGTVNNAAYSTYITGITIPVGGTQSGVNYDFGLIQPDSVSGMVFADLNQNGVSDGTDYPITNVTITLTGTNYLGNTVSNVLETLTNGTYDFTGLLPGTYTVTETQPAGYGQGTNALGSMGGTNSAPDVFSQIVLDQNQNATNYNYGEILGSIGNYVWVDANADGVRQPAEPGIPGVLVFLDLNNSGQYVPGEPSATTDANGYYLITNLLGGTYSVAVDTNTLPPGMTETYSLVGGTSAPQEVVPVVLPAGTNFLLANFGYRYTSPTLATLNGNSFQGYATNSGVELAWKTLSEADIAYFVVNRQTSTGWQPVSYALSANSLSGSSYSVLDSTATAPGTYHYQLVEMDNDGMNYSLATCTVVVGSPIILTIKAVGGNVLLSWTGGTAPYHLYQGTALTPSAGAGASSDLTSPVSGSVIWTAVPLSNSSTNAVLLPRQGAAAFFRVSSGQ